MLQRAPRLRVAGRLRVGAGKIVSFEGWKFGADKGGSRLQGGPGRSRCRVDAVCDPASVVERLGVDVGTREVDVADDGAADEEVFDRQLRGWGLVVGPQTVAEGRGGGITYQLGELALVVHGDV